MLALDIPKHTEIFRQRDVRETPTAEPAASSTLAFVTVGNEASLPNERAIKAGEGIDLTDGGAGTDITISGENASTTNKGIASFETADFSTTSGAVSLKDDIVRTIDGDSGTANASGHNIDILGGEGINTVGASNNITISGEDATTSNKGIASFNSSDFSVSNGAVSLKNKTSYWSASGSALLEYTDSDQWTRQSAKYIADTSGSSQICPVHLPHGAVITGAVVYGSSTSGTWSLIRALLSSGGGTSVLASGNDDTEDTTITNATVDNASYSYYFFINNWNAAGDTVDGFRIKYTTDYV